MKTNGFRSTTKICLYIYIYIYICLDNMFRSIDHHQVNRLQHNVHTHMYTEPPIHRKTNGYCFGTQNYGLHRLNKTSIDPNKHTRTETRNTVFAGRKSAYATIKSQPRLYIICNNL